MNRIIPPGKVKMIAAMTKISVVLVAALMMVGCAEVRQRQQQSAPDEGRWESDIQAFERTDKRSRPEPDAVVFTGSSSIRSWESLSEDFSEWPVLNRGFGGSQLSDVIQYADRIILPYEPSLVFVYAGDNDLAAGKSPERVLADYQTLVQLVRQEQPNVPIGFIAIKPSPSRWHLEREMREANALVREYTEQQPGLCYVDVFTPMLGADGAPREELFVEDMLHMNDSGYELWTSIVQPYIERYGPTN